MDVLQRSSANIQGCRSIIDASHIIEGIRHTSDCSIGHVCAKERFIEWLIESAQMKGADSYS